MLCSVTGCEGSGLGCRVCGGLGFGVWVGPLEGGVGRPSAIRWAVVVV